MNWRFLKYYLKKNRGGGEEGEGGVPVKYHDEFI